MPPSRIFLVDDHPVMREGYASLIGYEPDLEICGEASTAEEAFPLICDAAPDACVVDLSLPGGSGLELLKQLSACESGGVLLVVSAHDETLYGERALRAGASGYLMKHESAAHVVAALRSILAGQIYASEAVRRAMRPPASREAVPSVTPASTIGTLTDRELEVFEHFGRGRTTREIADRLHLSPKTVESHRVNIKQKLHVTTAAEMIRHAVLWVQRATP